MKDIRQEKYKKKLESEESETDEGDQIENTQIFNRIDTQESIENDDIVDTDTDIEQDTVHNTEELENDTNKNLTNVIYENKKDDEVLDEIITFDDADKADTEMECTNEIAELQLDNELLDNVTVHSTGNTELNTTDSVTIKMTELPVENVNTEEEMAFGDLTIPGDYSDSAILEE